MLGKTPDSLNGSTIVRPSSIAFRTFIKASSRTALPDVRAVIAKPSRMGTPDVIRVPKVRVKRATAILRSSMPRIGRLSKSLSKAYLPLGCLRICLVPKTMPTHPMMKNHQKCPTNALSPMTTRVGKGNVTPSPANRLAKIGTTHFSSAPTIRIAMLMTDTGRSEEHTSELQSPDHLVCRLLLEKKKKITKSPHHHRRTTHG